jgi:uncharacterized protein YjbI with pentapeptide repeats
MERADLSHAQLEGAQLLGVKMLCANLEGANLRSCNFEDPAGSRANMEGWYNVQVLLPCPHICTGWTCFQSAAAVPAL